MLPPVPDPQLQSEIEVEVGVQLPFVVAMREATDRMHMVVSILTCLSDTFTLSIE